MSIDIVITDQGLAELVNAQNDGSKAMRLTHAKLGRGQYTPKASQTELQAPFKTLNTVSGEVIAEHLIHVTLKDEGPDEYEVGEFGLYTDTGILFALYSQEADKGWVLDKNKLATLLLAIDITLTHASTDNIEFGSVELISPPATYERKGVVQLADQESVLTSKHDQVPTVDALHHYIQSLFVGQVAYFPAANAPNGWLICDGTSVLRSDYPGLWDFAQNSGNLAANEASKTPGQFGPGDGLSSFTLPDLRGEFIRTLDNNRGVDANRVLGTTQEDLYKSHNHDGLTLDAGNHNHTAATNHTGGHSHGGTTELSGSHIHYGTTTINGYHSHHVGTAPAGAHTHIINAPLRGGAGGAAGWEVNHPTNAYSARSTQSAGAHSHTVSIKSNGDHEHSLYISKAEHHQHRFNTLFNGAHRHVVTVSHTGQHNHSFVTAYKGGNETRPRNVALLGCIKY